MYLSESYIIKFSLSFCLSTFLLQSKQNKEETNEKESYANLMVSNDITQGKV